MRKLSVPLMAVRQRPDVAHTTVGEKVFGALQIPVQVSWDGPNTG